jgi:hypothetical protein
MTDQNNKCGACGGRAVFKGYEKNLIRCTECGFTVPSPAAPAVPDVGGLTTYTLPAEDNNPTVFVRLGDVQALLATPKGAAEQTAQIQSKPLSDYSPEDQAFYGFWYGHMQNDQMTGAPKYADHSTARYIWDVALAAAPEKVAAPEGWKLLPLKPDAKMLDALEFGKKQRPESTYLNLLFVSPVPPMMVANAVLAHVARQPAAATADGNLTAEAAKLAPILRGMCEGGGEDRATDIYAADYQAGDGDVFVTRAAQLLDEVASSPVAHQAQAAPIYQVHQIDFASVWCDVSKAEYDRCSTEKRILFAAPAAIQAAPTLGSTPQEERAAVPEVWDAVPQAWNDLYVAIAHMMARLGVNGEIDARSDDAGRVMAALHALDGGVVCQRALELHEKAHMPLLNATDLALREVGPPPAMTSASTVAPVAQEGEQMGSAQAAHLQEQVTAMKHAAIRAHQVCYQAMLANPTVETLSDIGALHCAIHAILAVETPTCANYPAAAQATPTSGTGRLVDALNKIIRLYEDNRAASPDDKAALLSHACCTARVAIALSGAQAAPTNRPSHETIVREGEGLSRADFIERIVLSVAEIPDRDSPEDQPEMMLVTDSELRNIVKSALADADEIGGIAGSVDAPAEVRDALEAQIIEHRIAITPEYEGGWQAEIYGDEEVPQARGDGKTPSEAISVALKRTTSMEGK